MSARIRPFVLGSALMITLTVPVTAGMHSDAELLAQMQQEVQKRQEQLATTDTQCHAGQRLACEQGLPRREQLARLQLLIKECQQDDRESCTQLRSLLRNFISFYHQACSETSSVFIIKPTAQRYGNLVTTSWVFVTFDTAGEVFQGPHNAQHYPPGAALSMLLSRSYPLSTKEYFRTLWNAAN